MATPRTSHRRTRAPIAKTPAQNGKNKNDAENRAPTPAADVGSLHEKLEQKYNVEGCNTLEIVYARIENEAANGQSYCSLLTIRLTRNIGKLAEQAAEIAAEKERNLELQRQLDELRAGFRVEEREAPAKDDGQGAGDAATGEHCVTSMCVKVYALIWF